MVLDLLDRTPGSVYGRYLGLKVGSNPDGQSLSRVHSVLTVCVDSSGVRDVLEDISHSVGLVPDFCAIVAVGGIVGVLEVFNVHFVGHLSKGLPSTQPLGHVFHLVVDTDEGEVDGGHGLSGLR